jgi:hypothetical protein
LKYSHGRDLACWANTKKEEVYSCSYITYNAAVMRTTKENHENKALERRALRMKVVVLTSRSDKIQHHAEILSSERDAKPQYVI